MGSSAAALLRETLLGTFRLIEILLRGVMGRPQQAGGETPGCVLLVLREAIQSILALLQTVPRLLLELPPQRLQVILVHQSMILPRRHRPTS